MRIVKNGIINLMGGVGRATACRNTQKAAETMEAASVKMVSREETAETRNRGQVG